MAWNYLNEEEISKIEETPVVAGFNEESILDILISLTHGQVDLEMFEEA